MPETKTPPSDELRQMTEEIAREQNREPGDLLKKAVRKLAEKGEPRTAFAKKMYLSSWVKCVGKTANAAG